MKSLYIIVIIFIINALQLYVEGSIYQSIPRRVNNPAVVLQLQKFNSTEEPRTKPSFFEDVLSLKPGDFFVFQLDKWREIQKSNLFANITANVLTTKDGKFLSLLVKGVELPSITFSPEVSLEPASVKRSGLSGGLSFIDRNYKGEGGRLEFYYAKKENIESRVNDLPPSTRFVWTDNKLGKKTFISMGVEEDHSLEDRIHVTPICRTNYINDISCRLLRHIPQRPTTMLRKFFVNVDGICDENSIVKRVYKMLSNDTRDFQMSYSMQPYLSYFTPQIFTSNNVPLNKEIKLSGSKVSASISNKENTFLMNTVYDGGFVMIPSNVNDVENSKKKAQYNQFGIDIKYPQIRHNVSYSVTRKITNGDSKTHVDRSNFLIPELVTRRKTLRSDVETVKKSVNFYCQIKSKFVKAFGDGCIPLFHYTSLGESVRGYSVQNQEFDVKSVNSLATLKADVYAEGIQSKFWNSNLKPGIFTDLCLYRTNSRLETSQSDIANNVKSIKMNGHEPTVSVGMSLRGYGFRLDLGYLVSTLRNPTSRLHLGLDLGD